MMSDSSKFSSDGAQWEHSRAMLRPQFTREQVDNLSLQDKHSANMMQVIDSRIDTNGWTTEFDIQQLFFRFTMDSSIEFLFGGSLNSQLRAINPPQANVRAVEFDEDGFIQAFDDSLDHMTRGLRLGAFYKLAHTKECKRVCAVVQKFVDVYVQAALDRHGQTGVEKSGERQRYILADALVKETQDPVEIRNQLLNVLVASRDTTASLLGWLFLLLARQPEEYRRLRVDILQSFGTYDQPTNLTHAGLRSCASLQNCLNETLRLFPLVPINFRKCLVPFTTLPRGGGPNGDDPIYVREDDDVFFTTVNMHRDPDFWGVDAHKFRPTRWQSLRPGWQFLPFNGGPRICLGQQFAINQASFVVVRLLQRFEDIEGVGIPEPGKEKHHLTVTDACASGVHVKLRLSEV
jgi:cytochrome P450